MKPGVKRIAEKARQYKKLCFTSLAHHIDRATLWENINKIPRNTAVGVDKQKTDEAKAKFATWSREMMNAVHKRGYKPPPTRRVYIPKPGRAQMRPISVPTITDRVLQKSVADVLGAIYENDFLDCSFGGRPNKSAHQAVATLHKVITSKKVSYVFEADLKNFFGSLSQEWVERFLAVRVKDPRITILIKRWLHAGVMEENKWHPTTEGTVQGGPISVLISNIYLHYVLDLWIEKVVKPKMQGEIYYVRYLDDFVLCFQYQSDARRFQNVLSKRLSKFSLSLEPSKTRLIKFGRFAERDHSNRNTKPKTINFLGFIFYCSKNRFNRFKVGIKTEKSRLRRSFSKMKEVLRRYRHEPLSRQRKRINVMLLGHFRYYGIAGNWHAIKCFFNFTTRYWRKMLSSRSQNGKLTWENFNKYLQKFPLCKPRIYLPYRNIEMLACL